MKPLSDKLSDLADRSKKTEKSVAAALTKNRKNLESQRDNLKKSIASEVTKADDRVADAQHKIEAQWSDTRASLDQQFDLIREQTAKRHTDKGIKKAEHHAEVAEQHAADAISLAIYILDRAEYAIVDAALARADADDLVSAK